jgi:crotonobetainyl-CoA:carnitine CoA-transferase CaiB-like acyl-CoA transferase
MEALKGIRILAVEQMQALPFATQLMASLGAEVVKVEHPVLGESGRSSRPVVHDTDGTDVGATFLRNNLGKKSIGLDLKSPAGRELLIRLAGRFDVIAENFKAGTMDALGLGYPELSAIHPKLVYVSVSGFSNQTPSRYRSWPAYAGCVEAMAGFHDADCMPGERPRLGAAGSLGDIGTALFAVIGTLAALHQRDLTGRGQYVDIAMFDCMLAMADMVPFMYSMGLRMQRSADRTSTITTGSISDSFQASDGFFIIQVARDKQFENLARVIGHDEWIGDERLARPNWSAVVTPVVRPAIEAWAATRTKLEAAEALCRVGVPAAPCNGPDDIIANELAEDRQMLLRVSRPDKPEPLIVVGNPVRIGGNSSPAEHAWPRLGEHTVQLLQAELGVGKGELDVLRAQKVIA